MSHHVSGQLYLKKKKIYLNSENLFTSVMANVIILLHVMTGCDHNNGLYGRGKKALIKKVCNSSNARSLLRECGDNIPISSNVKENLKTFVLKYVYESKELTCAETRAS